MPMPSRTYTARNRSKTPTEHRHLSLPVPVWERIDAEADRRYTTAADVIRQLLILNLDTIAPEP